MHGRKKNVLTFDFGEKKIIEEKPVINFDVEELMKPDTSIFDCDSSNNFNVPEGFMPVVSIIYLAVLVLINMISEQEYIYLGKPYYPI